MYKKILVPLDGSSFSECILDQVKAIALGCKVPEVILLTVLEPTISDVTFWVSPEWISKTKEAEEKVPAEASSYLSKVVDGLKKEGVAAKTAVIKSTRTPPEEILNYAKDNQVDLIIMSTHGRSGVTRWAFGSVADKVVRNSLVPVLMASPKGCRIS